MKVENWKYWIPQKNMPLPDDIKKVCADDEGLIITCIDETKQKNIIFRFLGTIYSYRFTDEGCFLKTFDYINKNYKTHFIHGTSLFKVENSKYLKWFKEESYDAWGTKDFEHYVFYTQNDILEVLSPYPPEIEIKEVI